MVDTEEASLDTLAYTKEKIKGKFIQSTEVHPNTKQISKGLKADNEKATDHFTSKTNGNGTAMIFFGGLIPGRKYLIYVSATSP